MDDAAPDRPVVLRVALVLLLPLLGLLGLAGVAAYGYARQVDAASSLRTAVAAGVAADRAATQLARERRAAAEFLLTGADAHVVAADSVISALRTAAARAGLLTPGLAAELDALAALRDQVATGTGFGAAVYLMGYTQLEADLVALRQSVAARPGSAAVLAGARASGWLAVAREELAQIQLLDLRGADTPARRESLAAHRAAHLDALRRFADAAPAALRARLAQIPSGVGGDAQPALDALADLATAAGGDESASAASAGDRDRRTAVIGLAVVLALAVASIVLAARVARSLRRRRAAPLAPSGYFLAPNRSHQRPVTTEMDLVQLTVAPVPAVEHPPGPGLVALARRSQRLADTLVERLDAAERDEADPDRLAQLFAFDHLATRIRHDSQSLLVLAGADSATGRRDPVSLLDLLRAAQSRIEEYRRIEYSLIASGVEITPEAADDVVHLLAELFDNATRSGPPDRPVLVEGRRSSGGVEVEIADRGPGLPPARLAELNARLAAPGTGTDDRGTGIAVVARLAARHGIAVTLQAPPAGTGVRVLVQLPGALVLYVPAASTTPATRLALFRPPPRLRERGQALPGGEPVDVPHPRSTLVPVVPGPVPTPDGPTVDAEPDAVRKFLTGNSSEHPEGRLSA